LALDTIKVANLPIKLVVNPLDQSMFGEGAAFSRRGKITAMK
jgi:hypothetical protein